MQIFVKQTFFIKQINITFHFQLCSKCSFSIKNFNILISQEIYIVRFWFTEIESVSTSLSLPHTFFFRYVLVDGKSRIYYSSSVWWKQQTGKTVCTRGREVASIKSMRYEEGMQISSPWVSSLGFTL